MNFRVLEASPCAALPAALSLNAESERKLQLTKTIFRIMKLTGVLLFSICMQVCASGYSQKIHLSFTNAPLKLVFKEIERQSGMAFYYNEELINKYKKLNVRVDNASLEDVLDICVNRQQLSYTIVGKTIVIQAGRSSLMNQINRDRLQLQPDFVVTGVVSEESDAMGTTMPLAGASVTNRTSRKTVITDRNGRYSIPASEKDVLVFSFVGHLDRSVTVLSNNSSADAISRLSSGEGFLLDVTLKKTALSLDEAVVIGYGTAKKKDLTGSVSVIDGREIQDIPYLSFDNAMAGKAAGVQITKTDGTPGGAVRMRVRGSTSLLGGNDPLYVIDGVPVQAQSNFINAGFDVSSPVGNDVLGTLGNSVGMSTAFVNGLNSLGGLNPDDIESITILKDASSTAIYGSKAANGVIIITTKKGRRDMTPQIGFNYYTTYSTPVTPHLLNASQYKMMLTEAAQNVFDWRTEAGFPIPNMVKAILNSPSTYFHNNNTDWIKEVTRNTIAHNAEISVSGGSATSKYYTSVSFTDMPGVVKGSKYQRVSGKINLENGIGDKFRFITNLIMGYVNQDITDGAYAQALRARPDLAPYDSAGNFASVEETGALFQGFQNPVAMLTSLNNAKTLSLLGSLSGVYDFNRQLQFKTTVSLNSQTYNQRNFTPDYISIVDFYNNVLNAGGIGSNSNSKLSNWFFENTLTYNNTFKEKHDLNVLLGTSYETRKYSFFSATASGFPDNNVLNNLSSAITPLVTKGDDPRKPQSYLLSFYARANYSYLDKYLVTFTSRADGSSKFGPQNKFGFFPSGALAWRLSKENFLKNVSWLNDLKLRGSYGLTGTQNIGDQMYRTLYSPYSYGGASALVPTQLGNSDIKWETTREADGGIDVSLFNNRLQITADYYHKQTDGALISLPISPSTSYGSLLKNVVNIRNTGYELTLSGDIMRNRNFRWYGSVNLTFNKSLVTKLSSKADLGKIGNLTGLEFGNIAIIEGKPLGLLRGMKVTGIIRDEKELADYKAKLGPLAAYLPYVSIGDPMFTLDTVTYKSIGGAYPLFNDVLGEAAPKYFGGFTQGFSFHNFDLNLYFTFSQGGKLFWGDHASSIKFVGSANANVLMLNRSTTGHINQEQPRLLLNNVLYNSSLSVFNSSYVKLRSVNLNYRFAKAAWMQKAGMQNLSLFLSATNLFTITKYPGNNPETSDDPYSVAGGYFDVSNYPTVKTYSFGLKAGF